MLDQFFQALNFLDHIFWSYVAFILIMFLGGYLTIKMGFFQIRTIGSNIREFFKLTKKSSANQRGIHPLKVLMASVGGMIGIGNIVGIVTAVQIGGPGALFWVWMAAIIGSIIKYSEIFLGLKYRIPNKNGGYDGGPLFFLKKVFKSRLVPAIVGVLLCIYGVEIYQFKVIISAVSTNWGFESLYVMVVLLVLVLFAGSGGVKRLSQFCTWTIPFFLVAYISMTSWIILQNISSIPSILTTVLHSAFFGHAAIGGFIGSSMILSIQHGVSRAVYSGDLGIGYDSIIQSESNEKDPKKQARLSILGVFIDNLICSLSVMVVLISGVWNSSSIEASQMVQVALSKSFSFMEVFMPVFLIIAGFTTIIGYLCVGMKCAKFLAPKHGEKIYFAYALFAFSFFSFFDQATTLLVMSVSGAMLVIINLLGIFKLKHEIITGHPAIKATHKAFEKV